MADLIHVAVRGADETQSEPDLLRYTAAPETGDWIVDGPFAARPLARPAPGRAAIVFIHGRSCRRRKAKQILEAIRPSLEREWWRIGADIDADWVCMTWGSACKTTVGCVGCWTPSWFSYADDLDRIALCIRGMTLLLMDIAKSGRALHLIAHGLGCQAVVHFLNSCVQNYRALTKPFYGGPC